ncbi:fibronectin type III domain-containing protein, partial [Actinocorallia sp. B10E7]
PTPTPTPTPPGGTTPYSVKLKGSTFIKRANGSVPLSGRLQAHFDPRTKHYAGRLSLHSATGRFKVLGVLPVRARVVFEPKGDTTGAFKKGVLTSRSRLHVKVTELKLYGIPFGGGADCRTYSPAEINLRSKRKGTVLTGRYYLPPLHDCGPLTPLVNTMTAGSGNTVELRPKA